MIKYNTQYIDNNDIINVTKALKSSHLTQGNLSAKLEEEIASFCSIKYAVATNSATSALHLSCLVLGVGNGDYVWTTANSFLSSATCALMCRAKVDFVDINLDDFNICADALEEKLIKAEKIGKLPKVVIVVHFGGVPCEIRRIFKLSKRYNFKIIEDASHACGSAYNDGSIVGSCLYSDLCVFSFHALKTITTGEGGMITTKSQKIQSRLCSLRSHGVERLIGIKINKNKKEIWNYHSTSLGYNYRLTEIQAALGLSQLKKIKKILSRRKSLSQIYDKNLDPSFFRKQSGNEFGQLSYHLYPLHVRGRSTKISNKFIYEKMKKCGVELNLHYIPIYRHPLFLKQGFYKNYCPNAELHFQRTLSLPLHYKLTSNTIRIIIKRLHAAYIDMMNL